MLRVHKHSAAFCLNKTVIFLVAPELRGSRTLLGGSGGLSQ